eukprot:gene44597-39707_t
MSTLSGGSKADHGDTCGGAAELLGPPLAVPPLLPAPRRVLAPCADVRACRAAAGRAPHGVGIRPRYGTSPAVPPGDAHSVLQAVLMALIDKTFHL